MARNKTAVGGDANCRSFAVDAAALVGLDLAADKSRATRVERSSKSFFRARNPKSGENSPVKKKKKRENSFAQDKKVGKVTSAQEIKKRRKSSVKKKKTAKFSTSRNLKVGNTLRLRRKKTGKFLRAKIKKAG